MKLYADLPGRRLAQVAADLLVLGWVVLWVRLGKLVYDATVQLAEPARQLEGAGTRFGTTMTDAGKRLREVPFVGEQLQGPFTAASATGGDISAAGRQLAEGLQQLAWVLGVVTAAVPVAIVAGTWLLLRARFVRRASAAQRFVDADEDLDLFALRALSRQPMHRLAAISPDPAGAWRARDPQVVRSLALLELRRSGLRPPS